MFAPATPALNVAALPPNPLAAPQAPAPPGAAGAAPASIVTPPATAPAARAVLGVRHATLDVLAGAAASIVGRLWVEFRPGQGEPAPAVGRVVVLQARGRRRWRTIASAHTGAHGRYRLVYRTARVGSERLRVSFVGAPGVRGVRRAVGRLNAYRVVEVSWYGGGGSLACGGWLTSATMGVASRTLPCGTPVTLRYHGHTVRVLVVDRGPYVAGREYDLTEATKRALGFEGVGTVWATD
jgi:rare lipoprotein A